jgi:hypothetical protein
MEWESRQVDGGLLVETSDSVSANAKGKVIGPLHQI